MSQVLTISYPEFGKCLHEKAALKRVPIKGTIELTPFCNLNCSHCYVKVGERENYVLSYQEICHIIDMVIAEGCLWLIFSGGEPLTRNDFLDIYRYAKERGLIIIILSNGTLVTPEIASYLQKVPPYSVTISLYGVTKKTYEAMTKIPGSFKQFQYGIQLLLDYDIPLKFSAIMTTLNQHEFWEMRKFGGTMGVETNFYLSLSPRIDGSKIPCEIRLSPEEVLNIDRADKNRCNKWLKTVREIQSSVINPEGQFNCTAGLNEFLIDCHGMLNLCPIFRTPGYNLLKGTFKEGWNLLSDIRLKRMRLPPECQSCVWISMCPQCPAMSELEEGTWKKPTDYYCKITKLRAEKFGNEAFCKKEGGD